MSVCALMLGVHGCRFVRVLKLLRVLRLMRTLDNQASGGGENEVFRSQRPLSALPHFSFFPLFLSLLSVHTVISRTDGKQRKGRKDKDIGGGGGRRKVASEQKEGGQRGGEREGERRGGR